MKCCEKELPQGVPYVLIRYWCGQCNTEHLANAQEMTDYIAKLTREASNGAQLPDLL